MAPWLSAMFIPELNKVSWPYFFRIINCDSLVICGESRLNTFNHGRLVLDQKLEILIRYDADCPFLFYRKGSELVNHLSNKFGTHHILIVWGDEPSLLFYKFDNVFIGLGKGGQQVVINLFIDYPDWLRMNPVPDENRNTSHNGNQQARYDHSLEHYFFRVPW
jgi:hypothetical protein